MGLFDGNPLDTPPLTSYAVVSQNKHHFRLEGPTPGARVLSGATAAGGAFFAALGLSILRAPLPLPSKVVPLVFTGIGAGMAATGASRAMLSCSLDAKPKGLTFAWRWRPLAERTLEVASKEIEDLEIVSQEVGRRDQLTTIVYQLTLVTTEGRAIPIETFGTKAQANLRKKAIEAVTRK